MKSESAKEILTFNAALQIKKRVVDGANKSEI